MGNAAVFPPLMKQRVIFGLLDRPVKLVTELRTHVVFSVSLHFFFFW